MLTVAGQGAGDGTPFGRYRLIELIGRGGMGEVWRAHDTETDRIVAIKVLPAHFSDNEEFKQRFRREAHAAARLNTPHVIPIHNYGEIDGRLYVDMRLIDGSDLQTALAEGPIEPARAVHIIGQIALALNVAHEDGLLHRDIKPSNILLDRNDFAYLIDFGIARAADETRLTKSGNTIGTFQYIAPERLGTRAEEDARADIYSLACVLYECLTGHPPFGEASMAQLVVAHLSAPPPRPSTTQSNVPAQIDPVIATGMAKDPEDRYATTVELAGAARDAITVPIPRQAPGPPTLPATEWAGNRVTAQPRTVMAESLAPAKPALPPLAPTRGGGMRRRTTLALVGGAMVIIAAVIAVAIPTALSHQGSRTSQTPTPQPVPNKSQPDVVVTSAVPAAATRDLTGSAVSLSASYPTQNQAYTNTLSGTVPAHWPQGALYGTAQNGGSQVQAAFDVTGTQVTETFLKTSTIAVAQFAGPVYRFEGAPRIANVAFNAQQSAPGMAPTGIWFDANTIAVNDSGLHITNGAKQVLDVTFAQ